MNDVIFALFSVPAFFIAASGTGLFILETAAGKRGSSGAETPDKALMGFTAGAVLIPLALLMLGKLHMFSFTYLAGFSAFVLMLGLLKIRTIYRSFAAVFSGIGKRKTGIIATVVFVLFIPRILNVFFNVFAPPMAWDSLSYHLAIPAIYAREGAVTYIPYMYHSNWPQNLEILFALGQVLSGPLTANAFAFCYAFGLLLAVYLMAELISGSRAGIIAVALVAAISVFKRESVNGYVDTALAMFTVTALYAFLRYNETQSKYYFIACAFASAGAASVKILGLFTPMFVTILVMMMPLFRVYKTPGLKPWIKSFKNSAVFAFAAVMIFFAWYLKSWVDTGNPVWPFAYGIFGGANWSKELSDYRHAYYVAQGSGKGFLQFFMLPYTMITSKTMDGYAGNHIILMLLCIPLYIHLMIKQKTAALKITALFIAGFLVFWFMATQMIRFLFPGLCVMSVAAAAAIVYSMELKNKVFAFVTVTVLAFVLLYSYPFRHEADLFGYKNLTGRLDVQTHLRSNLDNYALYEKVNADDSIKGKICLIREVRGYYLKKPYVWGDPVNQDLIHYKSAEQAVSEMKKYGVSHIIYNPNIYNNAEKDGYTKEMLAVADEILGGYCRLSYCENNVCLYELK